MTMTVRLAWTHTVSCPAQFLYFKLFIFLTTTCVCVTFKSPFYWTNVKCFCALYESSEELPLLIYIFFNDTKKMSCKLTNTLSEMVFCRMSKRNCTWSSEVVSAGCDGKARKPCWWVRVIRYCSNKCVRCCIQVTCRVRVLEPSNTESAKNGKEKKGWTLSRRNTGSSEWKGMKRTVPLFLNSVARLCTRVDWQSWVADILRKWTGFNKCGESAHFNKTDGKLHLLFLWFRFTAMFIIWNCSTFSSYYAGAIL